ncbi:twin-arginine translocase subunit TatC [Rhodoplanes sp. SY1]|uniref:twin-arginine translocase subunit TatC n=1 Tax=Rhodoplanes sp. SY1 TaxID=3166646 RepID=UPI0038B5F897
MDGEAAQLGFWEHVGVLRSGVLFGATVFIVAAILVFSYGGDLLTAKLLSAAPSELVFLSPLGPFLFKMKIAFLGGAFVSLPVWLAFFSRFVGTALPREKRLVFYGLVAASFALGAAAIAAAYLYLIPISLDVLSGFTVPGTSLMLTAESYLSFVLLQMLVSFVVLELPVVIIGLAYLRLLDPAALTSRLRVVFLALLIGLAVLTPTTDVFTLLIVAVPSFVLCIAALAVAKRVYNRDIS